VARQLQRPVRETVTPVVLQKIVWAGANLRSFPQAREALETLAEIPLSAKQVRRITEQVGQDRLDERRRQVAQFEQLPLMQRVQSPVRVDRPPLGVVMMDGGRYQRRDHFGEADYTGTHWKEDKVGLVLHMHSPVHDCDPQPAFPEWLANADVVREIAALGAWDTDDPPPFERESDSTVATPGDPPADAHSWRELSPRLLAREVVASSECGEEFGWHLEQAAWQRGVIDAPRMAFVADGASVNWTIHRRHFSQMTGVLDLLHALSYAWKAARALEDSAAYGRFAAWIWQGEVARVIDELHGHLVTTRISEERLPDDPDPIESAVTYFTNHQGRMNYPQYRRQGLPLTSSHMESMIKLINIRMKGSEKFFRHDTGDTLLQLRADSLCTSRPLASFWTRWLSRQTGANTYRKLVV
jgi:hypothetical protein